MRTPFRGFLSLLLLGLALPLTLTSGAEESHLARVEASGKLVLRCFPQQANRFLSVDTSKGPMPLRGGDERFAGIDVEVLSRVAAGLGVELEVHPIPEPSLTLLLDLVEEGDGDLAGGGLTVTAPRRDRFTVSRPYHESEDLILVRSAWHPNPEDLWLSTGAVLAGSSYEEALLGAGFPRQSLRYFEFTVDTVNVVADGEAGFTFIDSVSLPEQMNPAVRVAFRFGERQPMVFLMPPDSDLKPRLDGILAEMEASGELGEILSRFHTGGAELAEVPWIDPGAWCTKGC